MRASKPAPVGVQFTPERFRNQVALVVGGGQGIDRAIAMRLARELGHYGINSNAVGPGLIRTRFSETFIRDPKFIKKYESLIPVGRIGTPEDVAGPATFLASRDADYVNGALLFVDGGQLA